MTQVLRIFPNNGQTFNGQPYLDLSSYMDVQDGDGMDPANPAFTDKVFSHSLLKQGGTLALEDFKVKELVFPLVLDATNPSATATLVQQIIQSSRVPGAYATWQDNGVTQATVFDLVSAQFDIVYSFRQMQQALIKGKLRLFAQPFGRKAAERSFAVASGLGPMLVIGPSYGGYASSMISWTGSQTIDGDAPALLKGAVLGASTTGFSGNPTTGYFTSMSVLPDANYRPLMAFANGLSLDVGVPLIGGSGAVASQYARANATIGVAGVDLVGIPTIAIPGYWPPAHRMIALARAHGAPGQIQADWGSHQVATVAVGDWAAYDLGTLSLAASVTYFESLTVIPGNGAPTPGVWTDLTAVIMLPDNDTVTLSTALLTEDGPLVYDGIVNKSYFPFAGGIGVQDVSGSVRGAIPEARPGQIPIIAFCSIYQGGSQNPQNMPISASVTVLERTQYIFE